MGFQFRWGSTCLVNLTGVFAIVLYYIYIVDGYFGHANRHPVVLLLFFSFFIVLCATVQRQKINGLGGILC